KDKGERWRAYTQPSKECAERSRPAPHLSVSTWTPLPPSAGSGETTRRSPTRQPLPTRRPSTTSSIGDQGTGCSSLTAPLCFGQAVPKPFSLKRFLCAWWTDRKNDRKRTLNPTRLTILSKSFAPAVALPSLPLPCQGACA